jgi:2,3-dihydroxybenzoate decarboxylase
MPLKSRRQFLQNTLSISAAAALGPVSTAQAATTSSFYRISTEETFGTSEVYDATAALIAEGPTDEVGLGLPPKSSELVTQLLDLGDARIAEMDAGRMDKQLLSLWSPGVQIFEPTLGTELAMSTNDQLAAAVRKHSDRFAGLTTIAPQNPDAAAMEIERGMTTLGLHGVLINSYTKSEFLDNRKFWPIFEAAQAHDAAIYIHPRKPAPTMYAPYADYQMDGAMYGFHMDTSTHAVRLLLSGLFDEFPKLKIVLGHMGEGLPFWLNRLDDIAARTELATIKRKPSEYFLDNFVITTSAMFWDPILELSHKVLGPDRILFGVDYPFASISAGTEWLDNAPLSDTDKQKIYSGNARRVFHLGS